MSSKNKRIFPHWLVSGLTETVRGMKSLRLIKKSQITTMLGLTFLATVFEGFGIAMLLPVLQFIEHGRSAEVLINSSKMWKYLFEAFSWFNLPVNLGTLILSVLGLLLIRHALMYAKTVYSSYVLGNSIFSLRKNLFESLLIADLNFFDTQPLGNIINILTLESARAGGIIWSLLKLATGVLLFMIYVGVLIALNPIMTILAILLMIFVGILVHSIIHKAKQAGEDVAKANNDFSRSLLERLGAIRVIKLVSSEIRELKKVSRFAKAVCQKQIRIDKMSGWLETMVEPIVTTGALIILFVSVEVLHLSLSQLGVFMFIMMRLLPVAHNFFASRQNLAVLSGSLKLVQELFDRTKSARQIQGGSSEFPGISSTVSFKNVQFSYGDNKPPVLENLNLTIPAGKMTAIVGRSGAGKSTLVDLIPRLKGVTEGEISCDGTPLTDFSLSSLRRAIAFVPQEGFLFDTTIEDNIRYGRPDASDEEVQWAIRQAYLESFIASLPKGLATNAGERGCKLSMGQRQRIVLARALLQKASLIIMDEPTSSLDSESEEFIQKAIKEIRKDGKTTLIVIAHRLSTIQAADQIVVLDQGRIVESGGHGQLMHEDEWYAKIVSLQSGELNFTTPLTEGEC